MGQIKNKQQDDRLKLNHIKTRCYWHKNRLESPEIDAYISSNDFQQDCQDNREGTGFSTNGVLVQLVSHVEKNLNPYITPDTKINSKRITNLNLKAKTIIKLLKET